MEGKGTREAGFELLLHAPLLIHEVFNADRACLGCGPAGSNTSSQTQLETFLYRTSGRFVRNVHIRSEGFGANTREACFELFLHAPLLGQRDRAHPLSLTFFGVRSVLYGTQLKRTCSTLESAQDYPYDTTKHEKKKYPEGRLRAAPSCPTSRPARPCGAAAS